MGDNSYSLTVGSVNETETGRVFVPVNEQREQGICIDDVVSVTIHGIGQYVNSATFENPQKAGDRVTVPADFVRSVGLELDEVYSVSFEKVEEVDVAEETESVQSDDDGEESDGLSDLFNSDNDTEPEPDEAEDEPGLGELFG